MHKTDSSARPATKTSPVRAWPVSHHQHMRKPAHKSLAIEGFHPASQLFDLSIWQDGWNSFEPFIFTIFFLSPACSSVSLILFQPCLKHFLFGHPPANWIMIAFQLKKSLVCRSSRFWFLQMQGLSFSRNWLKKLHISLCSLSRLQWRKKVIRALSALIMTKNPKSHSIFRKDSSSPSIFLSCISTFEEKNSGKLKEIQ